MRQQSPGQFPRMVKAGQIPPEVWNRVRAFVLELLEQQTGGSGLRYHLPLAAAQFRYKSTDGDYLVCKAWDGTSESGEDVAIAKPYLLRPSITARTIGGTAYTYTYTDDFTRESDGGGTTEDQVVSPDYQVDDLIFAARVRRGTEVDVDNVAGVGEQADNEPILWVDLNLDGRTWHEVES